MEKEIQEANEEAYSSKWNQEAIYDYNTVFSHSS